MTLRGLDIVCVGFADWDTELWTNQQHLMSRLGKENRVLFIESLGLRRPQLASRDLRRILRRLRTGLAGPRRADGVHVLSPLVVPAHGSRLAGQVNGRLLPALVRRSTRRLGMHSPVLWSYVPQAEMLVNDLRPAAIVYHCVDDIAAQKGVHAESFRDVESRFARDADLVLASAPTLEERMRTLSKNVLHAQNVADTELFGQALEPGPVDPSLDALPRPRVVFTGAVVATKLDLTLLTELARLRPDWSFALVGPIGPGDPRTDVSALHHVKNIYLLGRREYEDLPSVLRGADAALIPYALNELTASVFPMKVYEYLAAGLPVVATPLPAITGVNGVVIAGDARATAQRLDELLGGDSRERRLERSRVASRHSWEARLDEIDRALSSILSGQRTASGGSAT